MQHMQRDKRKENDERSNQQVRKMFAQKILHICFAFRCCLLLPIAYGLISKLTLVSNEILVFR